MGSMYRGSSLTLFVCVVGIQQCEVVSVNVGKSHLRLICLLLGLIRTNEDLWN